MSNSTATIGNGHAPGCNGNGSGKVNGNGHVLPAVLYAESAAEYRALYSPAVAAGIRGNVHFFQDSRESYPAIWACPVENGRQAMRLVGFSERCNLYFSPNLFRGDALADIQRHGRRGREDELQAVVCFSADIDVAEAGKTKHDYPTRAEAMAALDAMPLLPTIVKESRPGRGLHVHWGLRIPFDVTDPAALARAKSTSVRLQQLLRSNLGGKELDSTASLEHVFRLAGTYRAKYGENVRLLECHPGRLYDLEDFERVLPSETVPNRPAANAGAYHLPVNPAIVQGDVDVVERARRYVEKMPPAVSGQGGHNALLAVCRTVLHDFALSEDDAWLILREFNDRCEPSWSDRDLQHKLDSVLTMNQRNPRGWRLAQDANGWNRDDDPYAWLADVDLSGFSWGLASENGKPAKPEAIRETESKAAIPEAIPEAPRTMAEWRQEMRVSRLGSLDTPGIYLDCSPPGAGKSHADVEAAGKVKKSLTITPSHRNCAEVVEMFDRQQVDGAHAYPALTTKTCQNYEAATLAIATGLAPSGSVCLACPHRDSCDYQAQLGEADAAPHRVATHVRAEFSFPNLAKDRKYIAIDESAINLLRPAEEATTGLDKVAAVARRAKDDATEEAESAARNLKKHEAETCRSLQHVLYRIEETAHWLMDRLAETSCTAALTMPPPAGKPLSVDLHLWKAAHSIGIFPPQAPMRICKGIVAGEVAELVIRCDEILTKGALPIVKKCIMGVWHATIPENATTWFCDATACPAELERLIGRPVLNCTPTGYLERKTRVVQVPCDVKISSSPKTVLAVLRAVLAQFPDARRVGVITHQRHLPPIRGTAKGENLEESLRHRIVKVEHYRGGESRGSNTWLEVCDLLVVLGTPRVPPPAIRSYLIRTGRTDAAVKTTGKDGQVTFGKTTWTGSTENGQPCAVQTLAYDEPEWRQAHAAVVISELRQAIGRGREFSDNGVDVCVITNENLSLPLLAVDIRGVTESERKVLEWVVSLSDPNSKGPTDGVIGPKLLIDSLLEFGSDKSLNPSFADTKAIADKLGVCERVARRLLGSLESKGLVERNGERGGWRASSPGLALVAQGEHGEQQAEQQPGSGLPSPRLE